jgi:hypothetical protein
MLGRGSAPGARVHDILTILEGIVEQTPYKSRPSRQRRFLRQGHPPFSCSARTVHVRLLVVDGCCWKPALLVSRRLGVWGGARDELQLA